MFVENEVWGNIPLLHIHTDNMNEETPVVIFLHGFMSAKEHNLHYAYQLVHKGCVSYCQMQNFMVSVAKA